MSMSAKDMSVAMQWSIDIETLEKDLRDFYSTSSPSFHSTTSRMVFCSHKTGEDGIGAMYGDKPFRMMLGENPPHVDQLKEAAEAMEGSLRMMCEETFMQSFGILHHGYYVEVTSKRDLAIAKVMLG